MLQEPLQHELREALATRLIVKPDKNFDLLQGLLVYFAWYVRPSYEVKLKAGELRS